MKNSYWDEMPECFINYESLEHTASLDEATRFYGAKVTINEPLIYIGEEKLDEVFLEAQEIVTRAYAEATSDTVPFLKCIEHDQKDLEDAEIKRMSALLHQREKSGY